MRFRKRLFYTLALLTVVLAVAWMAAGVNESDKVETTTEAEETGKEIGQGIGVTMIFCITLPFFALFMLLGWRNGVGLRNERRHQEQIEALKASQ